MRFPRSLPPCSRARACDHGVQHGRAATVLDERQSMTRPLREQGRSARMRIARAYLGVGIADMADLLKVREGTYKSWESGRDPIPVTIWDDIDILFEEFDADVDGILDWADQTPGDHARIRVWRNQLADAPCPIWWRRAVSEAMRQNPRVEPVFPEDDEDVEMPAIRRVKRIEKPDTVRAGLTVPDLDSLPVDAPVIGADAMAWQKLADGRWQSRYAEPVQAAELVSKYSPVRRLVPETGNAPEKDGRE